MYFMAWFPCYKSGGGNSKDSIVTFNPVEKRENINSGEKHKTIFGKIYRWFADLKPVAFTGSYNDLSDKPSNFAPSGHTHSRAQITDFPSSMPASDVYAWAKAASKPAYTASEVGALPASGGTVTGNVDFKGSYIRVNRIVGINSYLYLPGAKVSGGSGTRCSIFNITSDDISDLSYGVSVWLANEATGDNGITPGDDNKGTLGLPYYRWNQIYATNSTISTSDRNEKKEISYIGSKSSYEYTSMTDEKLIQLIMGLHPVIFKRINGESGRPHHGIIAQDFEELMTEIDLQDHAAFIKSPVTKIKEVETKDEDGNTKQQQVEEIIPDEYRYGIRYEELIADLIRFCQLLKDENSRQQKKIEDLEKRIKILEDIIKQGA